MGKRNYLLEGILKVFEEEKPGKVLDLGCGDGDYSVALKDLGYEVLAADMDVDRFRYQGQIPFQKTDVTQTLPFQDDTFDYLLFAEVIEHMRNPYAVVSELARVLKPGGRLVLSTPNILNLKSRMRFLMEGCWDFFREPPLDNSQNPKEIIWNLHLIPWRYHDLEYMLYDRGLDIQSIATSKREGFIFAGLAPLIAGHMRLKVARAKKRGGCDFQRITDILLSRDVLFGRHLILTAKKK